MYLAATNETFVLMTVGGLTKETGKRKKRDDEASVFSITRDYHRVSHAVRAI